MNMKYFTVLFYLILSLAAHAESSYDGSKVSTQTLEFVDQVILTPHKRLLGNTYLRLIKPEMYNEYVAWVNKTSVNEWVELTNHPNPYVRICAFRALTVHPKFDTSPIIINHINDNQKVMRAEWDEMLHKRVGDVFIDIATNSDPFWLKIENITPNLFSVLIKTPNDLVATTALLQRTKFSQEDYPYIRSLVDKNNAALVALARYQKQQDVELIFNGLMSTDDTKKTRFHFKRSMRHYAYQATSYFPHADFFPILRDKLIKWLSDETFNNSLSGKERLEIEDIYAGITGYKNEEALELLKFALQQTKDMDISQKNFHTRIILKSIREKKSSIYNELYSTE